MNDDRRVEIMLPDLGTAKVKFSLWYVQVGDKVFEGDRIAEVLIPGATYDVSAPASGTLIEKRSHANDVLAKGQILGMIEDSDKT